MTSSSRSSVSIRRCASMVRSIARSMTARKASTPKVWIASQTLIARLARVSCRPRSAKFTACWPSGRSWRYSGCNSKARSSVAPSRTRRQPTSNGMASHLCGSSVMESASSRPSRAARPRSVRTAKAPYAPSTCIQIPRSRQTREMATRSSTAPVLVVPALALTRNGRRPAIASASRAATRSSTRRRNRLSVGSTRIWSDRNPRCRAARASDEWVWSLA